MKSPSSYVDGGRLWGRLMELARFGGRPDGSVDRQALTRTEIEARAEVIRWARSLGLEPATDAAANLFLRLSGSVPDLPPVLAGSHIDTQPTGGRFDGAYGVVAAFEAVNAFRDAGIVPVRAIEVVAWTNEEASRFAPGMTGSMAFASRAMTDAVTEICDADGVRLADALANVLACDDNVPRLPLGRPVAAYVEAHIEQGPVLEREGIPIGVVSGIQGTRRYRVRVVGEAAHAGTTERRERRDALMAAVQMVAAIDLAALEPNDIKLTVGLFQVSPNAPSVVPAEVLFSIDLRHPDDAVVGRVDASIRAIVERAASPCTVKLRQIQHDPSLEFPKVMQELVASAARDLAIAHRTISSAAGHDARHLHGLCPSAMIFVPCRGGVSHNPAEWAEPDDLTAGARVLTETLWRLAMR